MNAPSRLTAAFAGAVQSPAGASQRYCYQPIDEPEQRSVDLAEECALAIAYNGLSQAVMMISPADLEDFVVGFSLANGFVDSLDDIYDIRVHGCGSARRAEVDIASRAFWRLKQQRRQLPGNSSCGLCGVEALEQALPRLPALAPSALPPSHWLQDLRQRIGEFQPLGRDCGAVHAALFMDANGEIRLGREDIGRHNALDKLIGALARANQAAEGGLAIVTSRCSLELVHKVQRAGIPTLVSLSSPTGLAAKWAQRHNLNLIHLPHHSPPRVYSPAVPTLNAR
ncbi:formate dehydrogenase accessory protein [Pseudomonas sp. SCT]|uniref:Sulfur carrier protein FdhD n=1 Tax=Stutzerimonas stutzeri RCH2 TaxID=644801 RepID=L0GNU7_STUST|nr:MULTISPECIES: formate dehydrogenase accessory sulfurtransferase FdhD [Pseudomonadaceae]AGA88438.1 formate dehydrogenase family accessory protein FdhD [Stutzerimonas stutzeri RCH2]GCA56343.1 formate dehydrogenase accessory protein [Pseudomonas sp. SCT]